jgi:hypothetical protein
MELSPSREVASCATTQELPSIVWNPKVHYHVDKSLPLILILMETNAVYLIPILSLQVPSQYYPPTYVFVFLAVSFLLAFPQILYMHSLRNYPLPLQLCVTKEINLFNIRLFCITLFISHLYCLKRTQLRGLSPRATAVCRRS